MGDRMKQELRMFPHTLIVLFALAASSLSFAAITDDDVAAARRAADYAEAVSRQKVAEKSAAEADAAINNAQAAAQVTLSTSETALDKSKVDLYKSLLPTAPDPTKYKVTAPTAPNLSGTATSQIVDSILHKNDGLVAKLVDGIVKTLPSPSATLLLEDARTRTSVALYKSTKAFLEANAVDIEKQTKALQAELVKKPAAVGQYQLKFASPGLLLGISAASSIGEVAASFATILKTQYGATTVDRATAMDTLVFSAVLAGLSGKADIVDPDAIIDPKTDQSLTNPGGTPPPPNTLLGMQARLAKAISEANTLLDAANARIQEQIDAAKKAKTEDFKSPIEAPAKRLNDIVAATSKQLAALYAADGQGVVPLDVSQKGERIVELLGKGNVFVLSVKVLSSDVDTVASDALFKGLHIGMASSSVGRWRLAKPDGTIAGSGVAHVYRPWTDVALPR
jgi:hypothetical protein